MANMNTIEDLLSGWMLELYHKVGYPNNLILLYNSLVNKLKEEPDYEIWTPLKYFAYTKAVKPLGPLFFKTDNFLISNKGNLFSTKKTLKSPQGYLNSGYLSSSVRDQNIKFSFRVHRGVACSFIPLTKELIKTSPNELEVNHKDCDKTNNDFSNLEWCTNSQNVVHAIKNNLWITQCATKNHSTKPLIGTVLFEGPYKGTRFILAGTAESKKYGLLKANQVARGIRKKRKGCYFEYATHEQQITIASIVDLPEDLRNYFLERV